MKSKLCNLFLCISVMVSFYVITLITLNENNTSPFYFLIFLPVISLIIIFPSFITYLLAKYLSVVDKNVMMCFLGIYLLVPLLLLLQACVHNSVDEIKTFAWWNSLSIIGVLIYWLKSKHVKLKKEQILKHIRKY